MRYRRVARAAVLGIAFSWTACAASGEITILSIPGVKAAVDQLVPSFEQSSGHKIHIQYEIYANQKTELEEGRFDVAIFAKQPMNDLARGGKVRPETLVDLARTNIGVAVKRGAPKPPLKTVDDFKKALLNAKSVTYTKDSATGAYLSSLLSRLGVADDIKDKLILQPGGERTTPAVAAGEAEMGIVLVSDIVRNNGVELAGALPSEIQNSVIQTAGVSSMSRDPTAAAAFIGYLKEPKSSQVFLATGLEPLTP